MKSRAWMIIVVACAVLILGQTTRVWVRGTGDPEYMQFSASQEDVPTALTTIGDTYYSRLWDLSAGIMALEVFSAATSTGTLSDFQLQLRDHPSGEWYAFLSGTDWNTATEALPFVTSQSPDDLPANTYAHAHVRLRGNDFRFQARTASGVADLTVRMTIVKE